MTVTENGKPVDGLKLSQHDSDIFSPALAVAANGVIHAAFVEKHRTTYALAVYHRSSSDDGKTWRVLAEGAWPNTDQTQKVTLEKSVTARFFKLEALQEVQNRNWTSVAEFDIVPAEIIISKS